MVVVVVVSGLDVVSGAEVVVVVVTSSHSRQSLGSDTNLN